MVNETIETLMTKIGKFIVMHLLKLKTASSQGNIPLIVLLLLLFFSPLALSADIKATLDRQIISVNESVHLTFSATQDPDDQPDFEPLKTDFDILNQNQQNQVSLINGRASKDLKWILNLMPKRIGTLSIPAISFGQDSSQAMTLNVTKSIQSKSTQQKNEDVFLEVSVSDKEPFVQAQTIYTMRFYRRVQITQASLTEPELGNAVIEQLGEDKNYEKELKGLRYVVTERQYAIFPQKSGLNVIKPLVLTAKIVSNSRSRSRFNGFFNSPNTRTKRVTSERISLHVKAASPDFKGSHWIPAEQVHIEEKWSGDIANMKAGEPLTRTLSLLAQGSTVAQLPELHNDSILAHLKTYPDQPTLKEQKNSDGLVALREEKIAYMPSKAGVYHLPAIEIPWFNTRTQTMEMAKIPSKTLTASAAIQEASDQPQPLQSPIQLEAESGTPPTIGTQTVVNPFWMWLSLFLGTGWLITLFFLLRKMKPMQNTAPAIKTISTKKETQNAVKHLKQACHKNDKTATKNALLTWGKIKFSTHNLADLASHCRPPLKDDIIQLNQFLYANHTQNWQGEKLWQSFTENNTNKKIAATDSEILEPLYKI